MDNLYYVLLTNLIILVSLVVFIVLITIHIVKRQKPKIISYIILILCLIGMYLFIPSRYVYLGYIFQSPEQLEKAIKYSINPYEKRLSYLYLAEIYNNDIYNLDVKNGNLAIEYYEKAINGEYSKYSLETHQLALLYSLKGDYKKTLELNDILKYKNSLSLRNIYIINDEYEKALDTFNDKNNSPDTFLKADLYNKLGNVEEYKLMKKRADDTYNYQMSSYIDKQKQIEYMLKTERYKSVEAYKDWLREQAKEYKF